MKTPRIDLVYFEGCPNAVQARDNIRAAVEESGQRLEWTEWDLMSESTPEQFRRYGSPTVLVDGEDVTGDGADTAAMACRTDGVPTIAAITGKLG